MYKKLAIFFAILLGASCSNTETVVFGALSTFTESGVVQMAICTTPDSVNVDSAPKTTVSVFEQLAPKRIAKNIANFLYMCPRNSNYPTPTFKRVEQAYLFSVFSTIQLHVISTPCFAE